MISNIIILIFLKFCFTQNFYKFEKGKPLKLYFSNYISENYVYLDYDTDFEISDTSQFTSHYYLIFKKKISAICKVKLETVINVTLTKQTKSDCEIIEFDDEYNILKYEKITNKLLKNVFMFYLNTNEYINDYFEIKKLSIPFRLENKSHSYYAKGNEIKVFFTQLKNIRDNYYLFLISKSNRVSLFIQENQSYKKKNILNNTIFKLYESDNYEDYFDEQFIILIYKNIFSYEETIDIGMKVINRNENINVFNLKKYYYSISYSCINKNYYILNTNDSVIIHINFDKYKSFKYYKKNSLDKFEDLDKSENFEELVNNDYYTNNYAIFSVECVHQKTFEIEYTFINNYNKSIGHGNYSYYKIKNWYEQFELGYYLNNGNIAIILLSDNDFNFKINYEDYSMKKNTIRKIPITSNKFTIYIRGAESLNSIIGIKAEIPKKLININYEPNNYPIKITTDGNEKYILFLTSEHFFKIHSQKEITVTSSMIYFNIYVDSGYKSIEEIPNRLKYYERINNESFLFDFERLKSNNFKFSDNKYFYQLFYIPALKSKAMFYFKITYHNELKKDTFIQLPKKTNNINNQIFKFTNTFKANFFILPCKEINLTLGNNNYKYSQPSFFKMSINNYEQILSYTGEGFISYHIYNDYDYLTKNYTYNNSILNDISLEIINSNTFRFSFPLFSNDEEIEYYLVITNKLHKPHLEHECNFLENFYLYYKEDFQAERYSFKYKNLNINKKNKISYIDLTFQNKLKILDERNNLVYRVMGISKSDVPYVKFYPFSDKIKTKIFYYKDYKLYIAIIFVIIIILLSALIFCCCKDKKNKLHYSMINVQELNYKNLLSQ